MTREDYETCDCGKLLTVLDTEAETEYDGVAIVCVAEDAIGTASGLKCKECVEKGKWLRDVLGRENPDKGDVVGARTGGVF